MRHLASIPLTLLILSIFELFSVKIAHASQPFNIYIDADRSGTKEAGLAIERGVRTALSEVDNKIGGHPINIILKDHRGSSPRSRQHLEEFRQDPQALVVIAGLHSPPLLAHRNFINEHHLLVLNPWAAAAPITRPNNNNNWIFRLSIDDSKAGNIIANHAVRNDGFQKPYLLLEKTGWGKSNHKTMSTALKNLNIEIAGVSWFNWGLGASSARAILREIHDSGADVIFLVANAPEGKTLVNAMLSLDKKLQLPIRSHWGITGGDFPLVIGNEQRKNLNLKFIQTRFSFINNQSKQALRVINQLKTLYPKTINEAKDITAATGFIHAYDITQLLIAASKQVRLTNDARENQRLLHHALENLNKPVHGLIKVYKKPFSPYRVSKPDAHEALGTSDYVMGYYGEFGEIILEN